MAILSSQVINDAFNVVLGRPATPEEIVLYSMYPSFQSITAVLYDDPAYASQTLPIARLYSAVLGRDPEPAGLNFYIDSIRDGTMNLHSAAVGFLNSPEAQARFGYMAANDTDFIQLLYHTVLGREGEPSGVAYYLNLLTTGKADRATVAIWISESEENAARMGDKQYVAYDVGHLYDYTAPPPPAGEPGLDNAAPGTLVPAAQFTNEDTGLTFSVANANPITVYDIDAGTSSMKATLAVSHGTLTLKSTTGLTFTSGDGTTDASMAFTAASIGPLNAALAGLIYTPDLNYNGTDALTIYVNDLGNTGIGGPLSDTDIIAITVNAVNDAPVNTLASASQTTTEDVGITFTSKNSNLISIADVEATSAQVTLSSSHGNLNLSTSSGITFTDSQGDHSMVFTGTITAINTALAGLSYAPDANYNGTDSLTITTSDLGVAGSGGTKTDTDSVAITLTAVNDAPVNTLASASQTFDEDVARTFNSGNSNLISIADVDATSAQVTLSTSHGNLTLSGTTGITFTDSQGDHSMVFTGTITAINTALSGLVYTPDSNYNGTDTLTITTSDQGATGSGGTLTDTDAVAITLSAVNDAPVNTLASASQTFNEDTPRTFNSGNSNLISIADTEATSAQVTLSTSHGNLSLSGTTGITFSDSQGDHSMVFTGTITAINTALSGLVYTPDSNYNGTDALTITTSDQGATGSGGTLTDTDAVAITLSAVNDAPVNTLQSASQTFNQDTARVFSSGNSNKISIADTEATSAQVTLSTGHGNLTLSGTTGITFTNSQGDHQMVFTGTITNINNALAGLTYTPDASYTGTDALTITTSDQGATGSGGTLTDTDAVSLTVVSTGDTYVRSTVSLADVNDTNGGTLDLLQYNQGSGAITSLRFFHHTAGGNTDAMHFEVQGNSFEVLKHFSTQPIETVEFTGTGTFFGYALGTYSMSTDAATPIDGGSGNDLLVGDGDANVSETMNGNGGDDILIGDDENDTGAADTLNGGAGNDLLYGAGGNDTLDGGADNDTLYGGVGVDSLTGSTGTDTFVFMLGDSGSPSATVLDTITDYLSGTDIIDFDITITQGNNTTAGIAVGHAAVTSGVVTFHANDDTLAERIVAVNDALDDIANNGGGTDAAAGESLVFAQGSDSYIFISDGVLGIGANDVLIKLTGIAGSGSTDSLTISGGNITGLQ